MLRGLDDIRNNKHHREDTNATDRVWSCIDCNAGGRRHGHGAGAELDAAAGKRALPVEMGSERRARLRPIT